MELEVIIEMHMKSYYKVAGHPKSFSWGVGGGGGLRVDNPWGPATLDPHNSKNMLKQLMGWFTTLFRSITMIPVGLTKFYKISQGGSSHGVP